MTKAIQRAEDNQTSEWNKGLCYRCNKNPQWFGLAWCEGCSIESLCDIISRSQFDTRQLRYAVMRYRSMPQVSPQMQRAISSAEAHIKQMSKNERRRKPCPRCGYPWRTERPA